MRRLRPVLAVAAVSMTFMAACGGSSKSSSSSSSSAATTPPTAAATTPPVAGDTITIKDFSFKPSPVTVAAGATVTVVNNDGTTHTVTADDKTSFDTKRVSGGKTATFAAPGKAGTYAFHCDIHQYMKGTLVIR